MADLDRMDTHEKMRLRAAAFRVTRVLPPNLARIVAQELMGWEEFGYRLGGKKTIDQAITEINQLGMYTGGVVKNDPSPPSPPSGILGSAIPVDRGVH